MTAVMATISCPLLDLLSNDLIFCHASPYIGVSDLMALAATSKACKSLVYDTPHVFRYVDLSGTNKPMTISKSCLIEHQDLKELYAQSYRTIFSTLKNRNVIQDVRTLVLDELCVPSVMIEDILLNERYQIRLLSLRSSHHSVRERVHDVLRKLFIRLFINLSWPEGSLKLRGLYTFGQPSRIQQNYSHRDTQYRREATGVTISMCAQLGAGNHIDHEQERCKRASEENSYSDSLYGAPGVSNVLWDSRVALQWPEILEACAGLISFDAVLCRHNRETVQDPAPKLANVRLAGCQSCGTCPEGPAYPAVSPANHLPLLSPPPLHSSKVEVAQRNDTDGQPYPPLILRCLTCLKGRWCENCNVWWCESCYTIPKIRNRTKADTALDPASSRDIKVHNGLCVSKCLVEELLHSVGEGGMWG